MTIADLYDLASKYRYGVLATVSDSGEPEAALVGIAITEKLELIFDTLFSTRKCLNLRQNPKIAFVLGWDDWTSIQYEGIADEPEAEELQRLKTIYFAAFPDGPARQLWTGITYFRVRPHWIRYSNFNEPVQIIEFGKAVLNP